MLPLIFQGSQAEAQGTLEYWKDLSDKLVYCIWLTAVLSVAQLPIQYTVAYIESTSSLKVDTVVTIYSRKYKLESHASQGYLTLIA